jgi:phosphohistidine phosphatase
VTHEVGEGPERKIMDLYVLRHGVAAARGEWQGSDDERPLTEDGRTEMDRVAAALARLGLGLDLIVTSPLARALQTAEIVAGRLGLQDKLVLDEQLGAGFGAGRLPKVLRTYEDAKSLMLVGHEPGLSEAVGSLVGGRIVLKKGGVAYVQLADAALKKGVLAWLLQPRTIGL